MKRYWFHVWYSCIDDNNNRVVGRTHIVSKVKNITPCLVKDLENNLEILSGFKYLVITDYKAVSA